MGGVLDPTSHILSIYGTGANDVVSVDYATKLVGTQATTDSANITVSLSTSDGYSGTQNFTAASVRQIVFYGKTGNDLFNDNTTIPSSIAKSSGTVSSSLVTGSPGNNLPVQTGQVGVYTVGSTGSVGVDYVYDGAGYRGQLGLYSLTGMSSFTPGTAAYNKEAARRALSNSTLGHVAISVQTEAAKFSSTLPWEGNFNTGHGTYEGNHLLAMTPGDKFGFIFIPNGTIQEVYNNPSITGSKTPLYSIPAANPYPVTSQLLGAQAADLDGRGSLFAFEDQRLDGASDRDYNDMTFLITGAVGVEPPAVDVINPGHDFIKQSIFSSIEAYAATQETAYASSTNGTYTSGVGTVGSTGQVGIDYLFDGGGYQHQVAIFSLQGMGALTPGSSDFIKEAARRALSNTTLGHIVISDSSEGARTATALPWEANFSHGATYKGIKTFTMSPGDSFGVMIVPAGTVWEAYNNPSNTDPKKRPLFSIPEANPSSSIGSNQFAAHSTDGTTFGFEDIALATTKSDRDYNDVIFRFIGATEVAPSLASVVQQGKNTLLTTAAARIYA